MTQYLKLHDDFENDLDEGHVIGSCSSSGNKRLGVDSEKVISIDNRALRISPLLETGWGRAVLAYGPFKCEIGLAFAVYLENGHNTAQAESLPDTFRERIFRWVKGSEIDPIWDRLFKWIFSGRVRRTFRQFRRWKRTAKDGQPVIKLEENLAVGWFNSEVVSDPQLTGSPFIMHALGPENGELWIGNRKNRIKAIRGVQNIPLYLIAIRRASGYIYYVSSLDGAPGIAPYPNIKPIGIDYNDCADKIYLGIHQSVLGQIGFRLDTRIKGIRVAHIEGYETWYGGAHAADRLLKKKPLNGDNSTVGGKWRVLESQFNQESIGGNHVQKEIFYVLDPGKPTGLIHALISIKDTNETTVGLIWRYVDENNHWRVELNSCFCKIMVLVDGVKNIILINERSYINDNKLSRLQVLDDGCRFTVYIDGEPFTKEWILNLQFEKATGLGFVLNTQKNYSDIIESFEAHCRHIKIPEVFDMGKPWVRTGKKVIVSDDFKGIAGDLEGRITTFGEGKWSRIIGKGVIEVTGNGDARIRGSVKNPCPGRTAYCINWEYPDFADLEVTLIPPGTQKGQNEHSIAGFILYQDINNYVTLNCWRGDYYDGASVSTFFKFNGFEDLYDAIWTNVGNRIYYGKQARLRLCCDGDQYLVFINDEPVLHRAFKDVYPNVKHLHILKVGIIANWEWGTDTGTRLENFRARI